MLSLDQLHLHSQPPLLILLVAQFTIARLGPVLGACPVMTTTVGPPPSVFNAGQPADTPTANLWEIFSWKAAYYRGYAAVHLTVVINVFLDIIYNNIIKCSYNAEHSKRLVECYLICLMKAPPLFIPVANASHNQLNGKKPHLSAITNYNIRVRKKYSYLITTNMIQNI